MKQYVKCLFIAAILFSSYCHAYEIVSGFDIYHNWPSYWQRVGRLKNKLWNQCLAQGFSKIKYGKVQYEYRTYTSRRNEYFIALVARCETKVP